MSSFGFNTGYIEELYAQYKRDPNSVSESWREFFTDYRPSEIYTAAVPGVVSQAAPTAPVAPSTTEPVAPTLPEGDGAPQAPVPEDVDITTLTGARARLAINMESSLSIPTATSARHVAVKLMSENRRLINNYQQYIGGAKVSFTHLIAWAIVTAIRAFPNMNTSYRKDGKARGHVRPAHVNIGLAIDVEKRDGTRALLVPNVKAADTMSFGQFIAAYNDLVKRARDGRLEVPDFEGTTVTLTNPGMIGTVMSVPRLMSGQGLIVAVGSISYPEEYSALSATELSRLGLSQVMTVTSTYDHRVIQGAESGAFLSRISELLNGKHGFYESLFNDLQIPNPPLRLAVDSSPMLGHRDTSAELDLIRKQASVIQMIRAYRVRGHLLADINPLGYDLHEHPELDPAMYGLTVWDLDRKWITAGLGGEEVMPLRDILEVLWRTYTRHIGVEFMHISSPTEKRWVQERIETDDMTEPLPRKIQHRILSMLNRAEAFERFLHTKYIGHKRFSLEGSETLIPLLDAILSDAADQEVEEVVIGMAHRGRLNVLANTLGKPYSAIFSEFEGSIDPNTMQGSGDVKYHLGTQGTFESANGSSMKVTLASNPSHLEAVDPVVEGMTRAKQTLLWDDNLDGMINHDRVVPILIHGDAAFAGQGVVAETLNLSQLRGYTTGGTIHVVVNNQIGFTTTPESARSSFYATDIARMIQAPIFHVNGDDPEAVVRVARLALDYRQVFNKDVVIDVVCYRVHGHNEADEPTFTQPLLYKKIQGHRSVRKLYTEKLLRRGDIDPEQAEKMLDDFRARLQDVFDQTRQLDEAESRRSQTAPDEKESVDAAETAVPIDRLEKVIDALTVFPHGFSIHPKLARQLKRRQKQFKEQETLDWALAESLAYGSLLLDGVSVRLSGQDSRRGTFSHRHSVLVDQETNEEHVQLNHISDEQAEFQAFDSLLSEYAVLGFEYGYSVADPSSLVIWEAQFGDFSNGAQIVTDQFISAAEMKWGQTSGIVLLLPHGYEGQGPEHSSARLERFLQLCAEDNMRVYNITTPANLFHALRYQAKSERRKPLILMSPKSLLRHPLVISPVDEVVTGAFRPLIVDEADDAHTLVLCSGKIYYDLTKARSEAGTSDGIRVIRLEQLYPFPETELRAEFERFGEVRRVFWLQEEPANMGAWSFVRGALSKIVQETTGGACERLEYVGRPPSASTATGSAKHHAATQDALLAALLERAGRE